MISLEKVTMNKTISVSIIIISLIFMFIPSCMSSNRSLKREQMIPLHDMTYNENVFAIEQFECSNISGDWIILYEGIITEKANDMLFIRLLKRYGYRYHPDKEGIDDTDWWCVPKKRHCYSEVKFTDWQGEYSENEIVSFSKERVYNANMGIVNGISDFLETNCKR